MRRFGWGDRTSLIPLGSAWQEMPRKQWSGAKAFWIWIAAAVAVWLFGLAVGWTITPWLRQAWGLVG